MDLKIKKRKDRYWDLNLVNGFSALLEEWNSYPIDMVHIIESFGIKIKYEKKEKDKFKLKWENGVLRVLLSEEVTDELQQVYLARTLAYAVFFSGNFPSKKERKIAMMLTAPLWLVNHLLENNIGKDLKECAEILCVPFVDLDEYWKKEIEQNLNKEKKIKKIKYLQDVLRIEIKEQLTETFNIKTNYIEEKKDFEEKMKKEKEIERLQELKKIEEMKRIEEEKQREIDEKLEIEKMGPFHIFKNNCSF